MMNDVKVLFFFFFSLFYFFVVPPSSFDVTFLGLLHRLAISVSPSSRKRVCESELGLRGCLKKKSERESITGGTPGILLMKMQAKGQSVAFRLASQVARKRE